jgi:hypothetical protein
MADDLPIPIEIPWQLAATTQALVAGQPDDTAITLFTFEPDLEVTSKEFPGQRVIFLKVTTTISPAAFPPGTAPIAASMLGEGVPCYHAQLDMIVRKENGGLGAIRPYFHAAAPLRREMLQTGVIGGENFEGISNHQAIGKSASQLHETSQSHASTTSVSAGGSFLGIGASASFSATDAAGRRSVDQVSDTTTRDASQERRELISHMTRVENVLTLLNAKYLGTPYLRFSVAAAAGAAVDRFVRSQSLVRAVTSASIERGRGHPGVYAGPRRAEGRGLLRDRAAQTGMPAR